MPACITDLSLFYNIDEVLKYIRSYDTVSIILHAVSTTNYVKSYGWELFF